MHHLDPEKLARRLTELREARGLKQNEVARRLGVSKQLVNHWERDRSALTVPHLLSLAQLYRVSVQAILFGTAPVETFTAGTAVPLLSSERQLLDFSTSQRSVTSYNKWAFCHAPCSARSVAFSIFDRAMTPLFELDDLVVVDPSTRPQPGDCVAIALLAEQHVLFRRYRPTANFDVVRPPFTLRAENPDYEPRIIARTGQPKFLGTLVEHVRFGPSG